MKQLRYFEHTNSVQRCPNWLSSRRRARRMWARIVFVGLCLAWFAWASTGVFTHATELAKVTR